MGKNPINFTYTKDGYIKIIDFPLEPQPNQIQGKIKFEDLKDEVIMDMNLPNEVVPNGAQARQKVGGWFPFDDISMPEGYNSINPWGQVFIQEGKEYPAKAKLHIKNLTLICYKKSTKEWKILNNRNYINGLFYKEDYSDSTTLQANIIHSGNEISVDIDNSTKGRCFHFWTSPVTIDDPSDILYTTVYCDAWISGDNVDDVFTFDVGADYRMIAKSGKTEKVHEVIGGRFKSLETLPRRVYATNLNYDKYFELCNQSLIDNLK